MMGGRGPIPCKFGVQCHRPDCWYSHPAGRIIDAGGAAAASGAPAGRSHGNSGSNHLHHHQNGSNGVNRGPPAAALGGARSGMVPGMGGPPQPSPRMGGPAGGNECRYAFECKRRDCHFNHPFGKQRKLEGERERHSNSAARVRARCRDIEITPARMPLFVQKPMVL